MGVQVIDLGFQGSGSGVEELKVWFRVPEFRVEGSGYKV